MVAASKGPFNCPPLIKEVLIMTQMLLKVSILAKECQGWLNLPHISNPFHLERAARPVPGMFRWKTKKKFIDPHIAV